MIYERTTAPSAEIEVHICHSLTPSNGTVRKVQDEFIPYPGVPSHVKKRVGMQSLLYSATDLKLADTPSNK